MARSKTAEMDLVNSATIAACLGLGERRVQQIAKDGIIPYEKVGKVFKYDLPKTIRAYVEYIKQGEPSDVVTSLVERKALADVRYREAKTAQEELKLAELEGTLHRSDDVMAATEQLIFTVRSMLVALPGRLAVDVAAAKSAAEASQVIRTGTNEVMEELTNFRYDPAVYEQMVRERQGWMETEDEESGDAGS